VDYQKTYDSVDIRWIWKALEERGLPNKFIKLIQEGYNQDMTGQININKEIRKRKFGWIGHTLR
jgi:hypothetical protein